MSGHSKWSQIKRQKSAQDQKKSGIFTKLSKNISLAAKKGKDPESNYALRTAIDAAKAANMPGDSVEKAILRGVHELPGQILEEVIYEGYGPSGVAMIIQCVTDNKNRTSAFIKSTLAKHGGSLSGPNAVLYLFKNKEALYKVALEPSALEKLNNLLAELTENDDVNEIYTNAS